MIHLLLSGSHGVVGAVEITVGPPSSISREEYDGNLQGKMFRRYVRTKVGQQHVYIRADDGMSPARALDAILTHCAKTTHERQLAES